MNDNRHLWYRPECGFQQKLTFSSALTAPVVRRACMKSVRGQHGRDETCLRPFCEWNQFFQRPMLGAACVDVTGEKGYSKRTMKLIVGAQPYSNSTGDARIKELGLAQWAGPRLGHVAGPSIAELPPPMPCLNSSCDVCGIYFKGTKGTWSQLQQMSKDVKKTRRRGLLSAEQMATARAKVHTAVTTTTPWYRRRVVLLCAHRANHESAKRQKTAGRVGTRVTALPPQLVRLIVMFL